ncbi:MAG: hypothetical protein Q8N63_01750 [Nanoarchaeota archaeon]|nr:hypothetical protein [Nanoarchaeota archaeon]
MVIKSYDAKKIGPTKFDSFYRKIVSTVEETLNQEGLILLAGNHWFSGTERKEGYNYMTYHHNSGSSVVITDGRAIFGGNVNILGSDNAVDTAKKTLDKLAGKDFKIEETH